MLYIRYYVLYPGSRGLGRGFDNREHPWCCDFVCLLPALARSHHMLVGIPSKKKDLEEAYATPTASHLRQSESGML